jgi:thiamine-phosphate pyrophosphorylase
VETSKPAFALFDLLLITPEQTAARIVDLTRRALDVSQPERVAVLLRAKHLPASEQRVLGHALRKITDAATAPLLISADVGLCEELAARGIQLPEGGVRVDEARTRLGPSSWIGASRHDGQGLRTAQEQGASFATLSPVFATPGKGTPLGLSTFRELAGASKLPVVALGGLAHADVHPLMEAGAAAIAVIRAVFDQGDPATSVTRFLTSVDLAREQRATL